jgi:hypothetical protein
MISARDFDPVLRDKFLKGILPRRMLVEWAVPYEISDYSLERALHVLCSGNHKLISDVESGKISVKSASRQVAAQAGCNNIDLSSVGYHRVMIRLSEQEIKFLNKAVNAETTANEWETAIKMFAKSLREHCTSVHVYTSINHE